MQFAVRERQPTDLAVKIDKSEALAQGSRVVVRFMIARKHPQLCAQRLENFAAAVQSLAERGEIAGGNIQVGRPRDDALQRAEIAVNIAEDQNFHGDFLGDCGAGGCGAICLMRRSGMPFVSHPCCDQIARGVENHSIGEGLRAAALAVCKSDFRPARSRDPCPRRSCRMDGKRANCQ